MVIINDVIEKFHANSIKQNSKENNEQALSNQCFKLKYYAEQTYFVTINDKKFKQEIHTLDNNKIKFGNDFVYVLLSFLDDSNILIKNKQFNIDRYQGILMTKKNLLDIEVTDKKPINVLLTKI